MKPDDNRLVSFLRHNRPVPMPASADRERELMELINNQPSSSRHYRVWAVPGAIAAALVSWGGYRLFVPSLQAAQEPQQLESFLVNSWNGSVENTSGDRANSPEADWQLLANPQP